MPRTETPPYLVRLEQQICEDKLWLRDRLASFGGLRNPSRTQGRLRQVFIAAFGGEPTGEQAE